MSEDSLFERGLKVRKEVLGAEYVEKSIKGADEFSLAMQEFATEAAWGAIWTRPGLPRKTRSLLNVAMLTILNRPQELKLHIRSSFTNGCTRRRSRSCRVPKTFLIRLVTSVTIDTTFPIRLSPRPRPARSSCPPIWGMPHYAVRLYTIAGHKASSPLACHADARDVKGRMAY